MNERMGSTRTCEIAQATLAVVLVSFMGGCQSVADSSFEFALVGDNPYSVESYAKYERLIDDVNSRPQLRWVVHVGDLKGGSESCSDEELTNRFRLNQRFRAPFVLTPGDNDWFDCVREAAGGYDDYDRLAYLRETFYPNPGMSTGGTPMPVASQQADAQYAEFVENVLWERGGVVFATVHVIGATRPATDAAVMAKRNEAAAAWIENAFARARASNAIGVFLAMQADPWIIWGPGPLMRRFCPACPQPRTGLDWLYPLLVEQSVAFERPVVLAVGDTHIFRVDKPLYTEAGTLVENFTRVETFGFPDVHWVRISVDPRDPAVFTFHEQIVRP